MSDCGETDVFWESWTGTPGKGKRKKASKKDSKRQKHKNNMSVKTDKNIQEKKKKKTSKFKEAMEGRKEKKKGKKKKKNTFELDGSFIFTQGSSAQADPAEILTPHKLKPDQDRKKKAKRKKKVAFDLSPGCIRVKRPKLVSSSPQSPAAVRDGETCSQVTATRESETHANESQCTSEEINSQDLFITQKTFRASPCQPSSGDASDKAIPPSPLMITPQDKLHTSMGWIKEHIDGSCTEDSHFHQHHGKTNEQKPKSVQAVLIDEEEEQLNKAHPKKATFQTQMESDANLTEKEKVSRPAHITPRVVNTYLCEPIGVNASLDVTKSKRQSATLSQQSDEPSVLHYTSTSTQTENFFTTQLSSYLNFCQSRAAVNAEDLKPLDLSLPQRARKDLFEVKEEPVGQHPCYVSTQGKSEITPSPESESEPKTADMMTSKLDLTQVKAVQMRLNESFFFKTKGEGQSPRPESPLMKLAQSRKVKSRKSHSRF